MIDRCLEHKIAFISELNRKCVYKRGENPPPSAP